MKKTLLIALLSFTSLGVFTSCKNDQSNKLLDKEIEGCFNFFMASTNLKKDSLGFGLSRDRFTNPNLSSIASTGFNLGSYPIYVEEEFLTKKVAEEYVSLTMDTILRMQNDPTTSYEGCISHFVNMENGKRSGTSEISTIDTAILVSGAIVAGEYFGREIKEKATEIWSNVDYTKYITGSRNQYISMGTDLKKDSNGNYNQLGPWDHVAEQLMIYIIGAGNPVPEHRLDGGFFEEVSRKFKMTYNSHKLYTSWSGSLFTYQFSHAFFDFNKYLDYGDVDWYQNSIEATLSAYEFASDSSESYKTFKEGGWGLTACDTPIGYSGALGSQPRKNEISASTMEILGTVAPCAALGSMPFTPEICLEALETFYSYEDLYDNNLNFGLKDAYNLDFRGNEWYCNDYLGIDKGITIMMLYNYKNPNFLPNLSEKNEFVKLGFENNGFKEKEGK